MNEEIKMVIFKCIDCNKTDEDPEYIIGEFSVDFKKSEEVEIHCPHCNSITKEQEIPQVFNFHLGCDKAR
ncbi:hypothetical protein [Oceanobacillus caeni]|uniref:hypothetical protein n=1 Tax=Oceanobacillus caeni TaxID=405946 RepID=UPI0036D2DA24